MVPTATIFGRLALVDIEAMLEVALDMGAIIPDLCGITDSSGLGEALILPNSGETHHSREGLGRQRSIDFAR